MGPNLLTQVNARQALLIPRPVGQVFFFVAVALAVVLGAVVADADGAAEGVYPYSVVGWAATNAAIVSFCRPFPSAVTPGTSTTSID
jgi:hypothetical protein